MPVNTQKYRTQMQVRPDDLDLFGHVHSSRYIDYVLAARFDQMKRCYKMPMEEFLSHGYGWVLVHTDLTFKRSLTMGEEFEVETHIAYFDKYFVGINFEILNSAQKTVVLGTARYSLYNLEKKKSDQIPEWVLERYSI